MKPFPFFGALIFLLLGIVIFFMGGWMFLAGVLMPLPHLSIILLTLCGCLIAFQGAYHWGMIGQIPLIILPQREGRADYIRMLLGGGHYYGPGFPFV
ncbi:hypothetical protein GT348_03540 [Aristophania vespae]|uniref:Uncharacterized protein n=1 Tax=Aristophania vespae TaxID=2697033 RepID=A0A6P1NIH5_9PROT|nr:hypothetical protein [Aristophania vespae]QHI95462.1 hypothetical protein GT348_03540 [Aristophania vespae]